MGQEKATKELFIKQGHFCSVYRQSKLNNFHELLLTSSVKSDIILAWISVCEKSFWLSWLKKPIRVQFLTMKLMRRKIYSQCSIALICLMLMISSMQGIVLCHAEDGHFAIELVGNGCCGNLNTSISSEKSNTFKTVFSSGKHNCGPCVDTPISVELAKVFRKANPVISSIMASPMIVNSTAGNYDFPNYLLDSEMFSSVNPCLASLRSIILLI